MKTAENLTLLNVTKRWWWPLMSCLATAAMATTIYTNTRQAKEQ